MKTFFTKYITFKNVHLSIHFCTILSILLGILCCIYLLTISYPDNYIYHHFTTKALAKTIPATQGHRTISEAFSLTANTKYQESIPAYETFYYYITYQKDVTFSIQSSSTRKLNFALLSDSGNKIPSKVNYSKKVCHISSNLKKSIQTQRIFLKLTNHSTSSLSIHLSVKPISVEKTPSPKVTKPKESSKNSTLSNPNITNTPTLQPAQSTTPNPQKKKENKKLSTTSMKKVYLNPHFICMVTKSVQKISIKNFNQKNLKENFNWISTNPKVATIKNGKVHALSPGISIIYIKSQESSIGNSSCFVRVISQKK